MLDISIKELRKVITSEKKAADFLKKRVRITEKFDGTKLTLIRNEKPFDKNYAENWIVSYKTNILSNNEFAPSEVLNLNEIKEHSVGISQYSLVHKHLSAIHNSTVPVNTEFFVEFIQNKLTLTRDYDRKSGLFLISAASTEWVTIGNRIYTNPGPPVNHEQLQKLSVQLSMPTPYVIFEGKLERATSSTCLGTVEALITKYQDFESALGGKAEGVVIETEDSEYYKVISLDQYDKQFRASKKQRFSMGESLDAMYWQDINRQALSILNASQSQTYELSRFKGYCGLLLVHIYNLRESDIKASNPNKHLLNIKDDLYLTAKLTYELFAELDVSSKPKRVGFFAMSGKPVHLGHWLVIKQMAQECDKAYLFVSTGDRQNVSWSKMYKVWAKHLLKELPKNVIVRFSDSPVNDLKHRVQDVRKHGFEAQIYVGKKDEARFSDENNLTVLSEADTYNIDGTKMRQYLQENKMQMFMSGLPPVQKSNKEAIWNILKT